MKPNDITTIIWGYIGLSVTVSIIAAQYLEDRYLTVRPFRWGYYYGCMGLACTPFTLLFLFALIVAANASQWERVGEMIVYTVYCGIQSVCGWFIIKRRWWAWVLSTILSFNILVWIINWMYGRKRKNDFLHAEFARPLSLATPPAPAAPEPLPLLPPSFVFACPHCSQPITATRDKIGSDGGCPKCHKSITVPQPTA